MTNAQKQYRRRLTGQMISEIDDFLDVFADRHGLTPDDAEKKASFILTKRRDKRAMEYQNAA